MKFNCILKNITFYYKCTHIYDNFKLVLTVTFLFYEILARNNLNKINILKSDCI